MDEPMCALFCIRMAKEPILNWFVIHCSMNLCFLHEVQETVDILCLYNLERKEADQLEIAAYHPHHLGRKDMARCVLESNRTCSQVSLYLYPQRCLINLMIFPQKR